MHTRFEQSFHKHEELVSMKIQIILDILIISIMLWKQQNDLTIKIIIM